MMVWIPLSLWAQNSNELVCYNRKQREVLAKTNLERIQYKEDIVDLDSIIKLKDNKLNYYIDEYGNCNNVVDTLSLSISNLNIKNKELDKKNNSCIKTKNNCKKIILVESIIVVLLLLLI